MELLLYQTLVGAWPLAKEEMPLFNERLQSYLVKASREAKTFTSWLSPDQEYEEALLAFLEAILKNSSEDRFLRSFSRFQSQVAFYGAINSLTQVLLKIGSPGVADFYQGTELWDFSLVDPDNRRPVDFSKRTELLRELKRLEADEPVRLLETLLASWTAGRIKMYLMWKALQFRRAHARLFEASYYLPLSASGQMKEHLLASARRKGDKWALVAVPRLVTGLSAPGRPPLGRRVWKDGVLNLPPGAPGLWVNVFTGESLRTFGGPKSRAMHLCDVFRGFPVALLTGASKGSASSAT